MPSDEDVQRVKELRLRMQRMRKSLLKQEVPRVLSVERMQPASTAMPLLSEMERCVVLISQGFAGEPMEVHLPGAGEGKAAPLFARDAFTNPEHVKFAIRGCLASSACYIFYTAVDWPGINTSVATCILTAFTDNWRLAAEAGAARVRRAGRRCSVWIGGSGLRAAEPGLDHRLHAAVCACHDCFSMDYDIESPSGICGVTGGVGLLLN